MSVKYNSYKDLLEITIFYLKQKKCEEMCPPKKFLEDTKKYLYHLNTIKEVNTCIFQWVCVPICSITAHYFTALLYTSIICIIVDN